MGAKKKRLFIEAGALAEPRTSGIGNTVLNIVRTLSGDEDMMNEFKLILIVPFNKTRYLERYKFNEHVKVRKLWLPGKVSNLLTKLRAVPYMDVFMGRGVYLFPNYKNWPLLFSRSITYVHDMAHLRHPEFIEEKNLAYLNAHLLEWVKRADKVVAVSDHSKKEFEFYFPDYKDKALRVYNGYDEAQFVPESAGMDEATLSKYGLKEGRYFMFLSNVEPRKNVMKLLEAFELFCREYGNDYQLLLVGGMGWRNEKIAEKIDAMRHQNLQVVKPKEFVVDEDLPSLMRGSIGLVHPAYYEGFGLSPLQAMACGKHVVVGRSSSIPEVVGGAGIYVDVSEGRSIKEGMAELLLCHGTTNVVGIKQAHRFTWRASLAPLRAVIRDCAKHI